MIDRQSPFANDVLAATRNWLERAVISLTLCPFAKAVHIKDQVRYVVSEATDTDALLTDLERERLYLMNVLPEETDNLMFDPFSLR